jgi:ATP-binding protein involved in chromosome partitioning
VAPIPDVLGMLIRQLLYTVNWGKLDYLIVDLPPGNGEPQATLCREMRIDGAVLVTTPQDIARIDTAKALSMFQGVDVPVLGVVRNMDGFLCPHCGEHVQIFPRSQEARELLDDLPLLGSIPLDPATAVSGDTGQPVVVSKAESAVAGAFLDMAAQVSLLLQAQRVVADTHVPLPQASQASESESTKGERESP